MPNYGGAEQYTIATNVQTPTTTVIAFTRASKFIYLKNSGNARMLVSFDGGRNYMLVETGQAPYTFQVKRPSVVVVALANTTSCEVVNVTGN